METECTTTKKEIKLIVEYVYMYKIYIYTISSTDIDYMHKKVASLCKNFS